MENGLSNVSSSSAAQPVREILLHQVTVHGPNQRPIDLQSGVNVGESTAETAIQSSSDSPSKTNGASVSTPQQSSNLLRWICVARLYNMSIMLPWNFLAKLCNRVYNKLIMLPGNCLELYRICTGKATTDAISPYKDAYNGPASYWERDPSHAEDYLFKKALLDPRLEGRRFSRLIGDQFHRFKTWPMFFDSEASSGRELRDGFVKVWSTFIIAETLLATVALRPFLASAPRKGRRFTVYGILWAGALMSDFSGLCVTTIFLAFLNSVPTRLSYMWVCNIGAWIAVPIALLVLGALTTVTATAYSAFIIYGYIVGSIFALSIVLVSRFCFATAKSLADASVATEALLNKKNEIVPLDTHV